MSDYVYIINLQIVCEYDATPTCSTNGPPQQNMSSTPTLIAEVTQIYFLLYKLINMVCDTLQVQITRLLLYDKSVIGLI